MLVTAAESWEGEGCWDWGWGEGGPRWQARPHLKHLQLLQEQPLGAGPAALGDGDHLQHGARVCGRGGPVSLTASRPLPSPWVGGGGAAWEPGTARKGGRGDQEPDLCR